MLDAEADELCGAKRYERSVERLDTRAGHYERSLETKAGKVKLKVPKLRTIPFESAIIDRYRRRECSVEEALMEMYLAGVSVRREEDITEALWGTRVSAGVVSKLNQELYDKIDMWRTRPLQGTYPYVFLDGIVMKPGPMRSETSRSWLPLVSMKTAIARFLAPRKVPRRTKQAGAPSSNRLSSVAYRAFNCSSLTNAWVWLNPLANTIQKRPGSDVRFISIKTYSPMFPRRK
jgi:hypothetical protein